MPLSAEKKTPARTLTSLFRDCRDSVTHVDPYVRHTLLVRLLVGPFATIAMGATVLALATLSWWSFFVAVPASAVARVVDRSS